MDFFKVRSTVFAQRADKTCGKVFPFINISANLANPTRLLFLCRLGLRFDTLLLPVVLVWYIFTELGSVAENAAALGAPIPKVLLDALAVGKREP